MNPNYKRPSYQNSSSWQSNSSESSGRGGGRGRGWGGDRGGRGRGGGGGARGRGFTPHQLNQVTFDYKKISPSPTPYENRGTGGGWQNEGSNRFGSQPSRMDGPPARTPYGQSSSHQSQRGRGLGSSFATQGGSRYVPPHMRAQAVATATTSPTPPRAPSVYRFHIPVNFVKGTGLDEIALKKLAETQMSVRKKPPLDEGVTRGTLENPTFSNVIQPLDFLSNDQTAPEEFTFDSWNNHHPVDQPQSQEVVITKPIDSTVEVTSVVDSTSMAKESMSQISEHKLPSTQSVIDSPLQKLPDSLTAPSKAFPITVDDSTDAYHEDEKPSEPALVLASPSKPDTEAVMDKSPLPTPQLGATKNDTLPTEASMPVAIKSGEDPVALIESLKVSDSQVSPTSTVDQNSIVSSLGPLGQSGKSDLSPTPDTSVPHDEDSPAFVIDCEGDASLTKNLDSTSTIPKRSYQPLHEPVLLPKLKGDEEEIHRRVAQTSSTGQPFSVSHLSRSIVDPYTSEASPLDTDRVTILSADSTTARQTENLKKATQRRREARRVALQNQRQREEMLVHGRIALANLSHATSAEVPREGDSDLDWGSDGPPDSGKSKTKKEKLKKQLSRKEEEEMAILADYIENTKSTPDDDEGDDNAIADDETRRQGAIDDEMRMRSFVNSMSGSGSKHKTIDDFEDEKKMAEDKKYFEKGIYQSDSDDSNDDKLDDGSLSEVLDEWVRDSDVTQESRSDLSFDDFSQFNFKYENDDIEQPMSGEDSKMKETELDSDDEDEEEQEEKYQGDNQLIWGTDPKVAREAAAKAPGKGKSRSDGKSDDPYLDTLQLQWEKDRKRKASRRALRESAKIAAEIDRTKKKEAKETRIAAKANDHVYGRDIYFMMSEFVQYFINKRKLKLPPANKAVRAKIHLAARVYFLKSHSTGKGDDRRTTLERTCDTRYTEKANYLAWKYLTGRTDYKFNNGLQAPHPPNREGALVGQGAEELGKDNVGFQLLAKMGWIKGETMGSISSNNGLQAPIMAVVKNSKDGLGMFSRIK